MNYIQQNKDAWEEAFDNRDPQWGKDVSEKVISNKYAFFNKDMAVELEKLNCTDKTIAHFCCNNGRELLSLVKWANAKEGIGFDIAENQVAFANDKAKELNLNCRFISKNILEIDDTYNNKFDLIIITIGCLCWFKDLDAFFEIVSKTLKQNGNILVNEWHPVLNMLSAPGDENYNEKSPLNLVNSYFNKEWKGNEGMYYIAKRMYSSKTFTDYTHSFTEIINSMLKNAMSIESLTEFDYDISSNFTNLSNKEIPLSYILKARKK